MKLRILIPASFWAILQFVFSPLESQIYTAGNGLSVSGTGTATKVESGGILTKNTTIDLGASYQWSFLKGTTNYFSILNNGNVGIGTATPTTKLDVYGAGTIPPLIRIQDGDITIPDYSAVGFTPALTANTTAQLLPWSSTFGGVQLSGFSNTSDSRAALVVGYSGKTTVNNPVVNFMARKHNGSNNLASLAATEPAFEFLNYATPLIRVLGNGNVGIGTITPQSKLAVNGDIYSKKVRVTQTGWPDYVFQSNYQLPSLVEVEKYIRAHQHLPEVPSAAEVEKEGLDLGNNQALLLKKIEELTLYLIDQKKMIDQQHKSLESQQQEIKELKEAIKKMAVK